MFSSRHSDTLKGLVDELGPLARVGTVAGAVEFGDVVMVVVPYTAMEQIGKDYGSALAKKVLVIDVSNSMARRDGAEIVKWVDDQGGAGLATAKFLPGAHIVRAFNAINCAKLSADTHRPSELVGVPIAGDDPHAIDIASSLIREIGFDPVVIGGLEMGKYLVPGTPFAGEHTAAEIRQIVTNLRLAADDQKSISEISIPGPTRSFADAGFMSGFLPNAGIGGRIGVLAARRSSLLAAGI